MARTQRSSKNTAAFGAKAGTQRRASGRGKVAPGLPAGMLAVGASETATKESASRGRQAYAAVKLEGRVEDPTSEEVAREQARMDEEVQGTRDSSKKAPAPGQDLLASYMSQLSHIPLFTPEEEARNARHLETLELHTWNLILTLPRGASHTHAESVNLDPGTQRKLARLLQSYRRAANRTRAKTLKMAPSRQKLIHEISACLRGADSDLVLLGNVLVRMRRDVWSRRVIDAKPCFRINHNQLVDIERAQTTATRARNNFVRANLRLVVSVARNFHHFRIPFIDLIQEGNVGLMKAVHRFDHRRGFRFSTYAHWWIRQSIERAIINKGSQVRLPVHVIDSRRQVRRATAKLTQRLGRRPDAVEISKTLHLSTTKVEQIQRGIKQDPISLDEAISGDDPRRFLDMVRNDEQPAIDEALIRENTFDRLRDLLQLLNPIEKDIIRRRFGLGDDSDQTLDEIGRIYNLSRERVRQIQAQGLLKMRRMCERREIGA